MLRGVSKSFLLKRKQKYWEFIAHSKNICPQCFRIHILESLLIPIYTSDKQRPVLNLNIVVMCLMSIKEI